MTNEELQVKTIQFLRFPLIVGVVIIHSGYKELIIDGVDWMKNNHFPVYSITSYFFSEIVATIAVPLFFVLSGYLFFYKTASFDRKIYLQKIKKRIRTLLVPYLFWNFAVIVLLFLSQTFFSGLMSGNKKLICDYTFSDWLWSFWNMDKVNSSSNPYLQAMPVCYQLWFIRDLMIVMLFSPFLYFLLNKYGKYILISLGTLWLFDDNYFYVPGLNITAFFFFSVGAYFSIYEKNFVERMKPFLFVSAGLYSIMALIEIYFREQMWNEYLHRINILVGMVLIIALCAHFIEKGKWKASLFLASSSFFIYAFHGMPIALVFKSLFKMIRPNSDWMMLTLYVISPTIVILTGLYFYFILKKYLPKFTALITGGR